MDWENIPTTVFVLSVFVIVCCLDWFSSRFLALFPFCMLVHMVNRHRARANGDFLTPFEEVDDVDSALEAEVRVAVIGCDLKGNSSIDGNSKSYQVSVFVVSNFNIELAYHQGENHRGQRPDRSSLENPGAFC